MLVVVFFHAGVISFSGGFVGVDVFFVISGYLISTLILDEIHSGNFSYSSFYKRRAARLLPALLITLIMVLLFGLFFYDNKALDNLGKETLFSAFGLANILFAQGTNYFAQEGAVRPLIHLWSLGVEEQFYFIWPTVLLLLLKFFNRHLPAILTTITLVSFALACFTVERDPVAAYFYPQYRAFELMIGAITALLMNHKKLDCNQTIRECIMLMALAMIILPVFLLSEASTFPGIHTLWPCLGTAIFILSGKDSRLSKPFTSQVMVMIGLISYPLYLFHQPFISWMNFFNVTDASIKLAALTLIICTPAAWCTYQFVEKPIRLSVKQADNKSLASLFILIIMVVLIGLAGLMLAKTNGFGARLKYLNPFAHEVSLKQETTFHNNFKRGFYVSGNINKKILFIGDSLLQQYVYPIMNAFDAEADEIDIVSRGGCVLLNEVEFIDTFSDISCNKLREKLYRLDHSYDYVVISQFWDSYKQNVRNFPEQAESDSFEKWMPFLKTTTKHFQAKGSKVLIIGQHPRVSGTKAFKPGVFLKKRDYLDNLEQLQVTNEKSLQASVKSFEPFSLEHNVIMLHPLDIWRVQPSDYELHNGEWSYFYDGKHFSSVADDFVETRIRQILTKQTNGP